MHVNVKLSDKKIKNHFNNNNNEIIITYKKIFEFM